MAIATGTALIGAAIAGAGASAYSARQGSDAARGSARNATEAEMAMYNQSRADLAPYRAAGARGLGQLERMFLGTPGQQRAAMRDFRTSPNYQFVRGEGLSALENSGAARGGALSGNAVRGATEFASGLASGEFNNYVNRLFGIAGLGSGATNVGVQAGQNTANSLAGIYQNQGNARASAYNNLAGGVNNAVQGGLQNWAFNTYMNRDSGGGGGAFYG